MRQRNGRQIGTLIVALFMVLNLLVGSVPAMGVQAMSEGDETTASVEAVNPMGEEKPASPPAASGSEGAGDESESAESEKPAESTGSLESSESSESSKVPSEDGSTSGSSDESDGSAESEASSSETDGEDPDLEISDEEIPDAVGQSKQAVISLELYLHSDVEPQGLPEGFVRRIRGPQEGTYTDVQIKPTDKPEITNFGDGFYKISCTYMQSNRDFSEGYFYTADFHDKAGKYYTTQESKLHDDGTGTFTTTIRATQWQELYLYLRDTRAGEITVPESLQTVLPAIENGQSRSLQIWGNESEDRLYSLFNSFKDNFQPQTVTYDLTPMKGVKIMLGDKWFIIQDVKAHGSSAYEYDLTLDEFQSESISFDLHLQTTMWKMFGNDISGGLHLVFEINGGRVEKTLGSKEAGPDEDEIPYENISFESIPVSEDGSLHVKLLTPPSPGDSDPYGIVSQEYKEDENALYVQIGRTVYFVGVTAESYDGKNYDQTFDTFIDCGPLQLYRREGSELIWVQESTFSKNEAFTGQKFTALVPGTYEVELEPNRQFSSSEYLLPIRATLVIEKDGSLTLDGAPYNGEGTDHSLGNNVVLLEGIKNPLKLFIPRRPQFNKTIIENDDLRKIVTIKSEGPIQFRIPITIYPEQNIVITNKSETKVYYSASHRLRFQLLDTMSSHIKPIEETIRLQERKNGNPEFEEVLDYAWSYKDGEIEIIDHSKTIELPWSFTDPLKIPAPRELVLSFEATVDSGADLDAILENTVISHGQKDKVQLIPLVDLEVTKNWEDMTKDEIEKFKPVFKLSQVSSSGNVLSSWTFDQDHSGLLNDDGSSEEFEFTWNVGDTVDGLPVPEQDPNVIKTATVTPKVSYEMVDGKGVYSIQDLPHVDAAGNKVSYKVEEIKILKGDQDVTKDFDQKQGETTYENGVYKFTFNNSKKPTETTSTTKPTRPTSTRPTTSQTTTTQPTTSEPTTTTQPTTTETTTTQPTTTPTTTETTTTETTTTETTTMETTTVEPTTLPPTTEPPTTPPTTTEPTIAKTGEDYPWGAPALLLLMAGCLYIIRKRHERG